jgi:lipopolysaccharide transport system ATP-binding protein
MPPVAAVPDARPAIRVNGISKLYKVYPKPGDVIIEALSGKPRHSEHWALRDISFDVPRGSVVGVLGPNGAGKSTLLKIIAGTLQPTSGSVEVNGKISAILELGTGFHEDYSGRDNIVLGGMCAGMSREEITGKISDIIAFSELESVIDQPFKTYSSGMKARLTFATAISVDAELLIIDEALAAGDSYFVAKCMKRIRQICTSGATVLFVSHSTYMIIELCDTALWIDRGLLAMTSTAYDVAKAYERSELERANRHGLLAASKAQIDKKLAKVSTPAISGTGATTDPQTTSPSTSATTSVEREDLTAATYVLADRGVEVFDLKLLDKTGSPRSIFPAGDDIVIQGRWRGHTQDGQIAVGLRLDSNRLQAVAGYTSDENGVYLNTGLPLEGEGKFNLTIKQHNLGQGDYFVTLSIKTVDFSGGDGTLLFLADRVLAFKTVRNKRFAYQYVCELDFDLKDIDLQIN